MGGSSKREINMAKTYINDSYTTEDQFHCDNYPCPDQEVVKSFKPGEVQFCPECGTPLCPVCGKDMEEPPWDTWGRQDYQERMTERRQMGLQS